MKTATRLCVVTLLCILSASPAIAGMAKLTQAGSFGQGGAFYVELQPAAPWLKFGQIGSPLKDATFCVEETIFLTGTWYTYTVDDTILNATGSTSAIQAMTKNLFAEYVFGTTLYSGQTLAQYVGTDATRNKALQDLFWDLQGVGNDNGSSLASGDPYDVIKTNWGSTGNVYAAGVKAFNLWEGAAYGSDKQSHLVWVPAPGAALLVLCGLSAVGWVKRRLA